MTMNRPRTAHWIKSSYSGSNGGNCVEVDLGSTTAVPVRDSKNPDGPVLAFTPTAFTAFLRTLTTGVR